MQYQGVKKFTPYPAGSGTPQALELMSWASTSANLGGTTMSFRSTSVILAALTGDSFRCIRAGTQGDDLRYCRCREGCLQSQDTSEKELGKKRLPELQALPRHHRPVQEPFQNGRHADGAILRHVPYRPAGLQHRQVHRMSQGKGNNLPDETDRPGALQPQKAPKKHAVQRLPRQALRCRIEQAAVNGGEGKGEILWHLP